MSRSSSRRLMRAAGAAVTGLVTVPLLAAPASAVISDPPTAPHSIIVFPQRDFVSSSGFTSSDRVTVNVRRGGVVVGTATGLVPQDDPGTPGFDGLVEVNHPGGGCWEGVTPDIRPGDVVQTLTAPDTGDQTPTADVVVTAPAASPTPGSGTVEVKGTAVDALGARIPLDQLEVRLVANKQAFVVNGRRTLRADATGTADGLLGYDTPTGTSWTATFTGLTRVSPVDGLTDEQRALQSESRGMWRGRNPATTAEATIYEYGVVGGPAAPCTAPLASGPTTPDLTAATDTGVSATDDVTSSTTPVFVGATALATATAVNLYVDGVLAATGPAGPGGAYSLSPGTPLGDGRHSISAGEVAPSGVETRSVGALSVTVDTAAPAAPTLTATTPPSPGSSLAPAVRGTAEAGSTVGLFDDAACTHARGSGSAADLAGAGIGVTVPTGSTTSFFATATDPAGNASGCSTSTVTYAQDSVAPPAPTIAGTSTSGLVRVTTARFDFSDNEAAATFQCSVDGAAFADCTSPRQLAGVGEGAHTFAVRARDAAGNVSDPASTSWTVDTTAPTVAITAPTAAVINDPRPVFRFTASEAGSTLRCSVDGAAPAPCTTSTSHASATLADGPHTFSVSATDPAGNTGPASTYSFQVDTAVPVVSIDATPPSPSRDNTPSFAFSSPTAGVTFTCAFALASVATPSFTACATGTFTSAARADGDYRFSVRATDTAGNVGTASALLTIDTVAPTAPTITSRPAASSTQRTPSFGFGSSEPGASFDCTLTPGAGTAPCTSGETYGPLPDGAYVFRVRARDAAGNVGPAATAGFSVDTVAPTVTGRTPAPGATAVGQTGNLTATFGEAVTGVGPASFTLSAGSTSVPAAVSYDAATHVATLDPAATLAADTLYTVRLTGATKDAAGNALAPLSWTFTTGPRPRITGRSPASGAVGVARTANVTATLSETVSGVGVNTVFLRRAGATTNVAAAVTWTAATRRVTLDPSATLAARTTYTATATSGIRDAAGNRLTTTSWSFTTGP